MIKSKLYVNYLPERRDQTKRRKKMQLTGPKIKETMENPNPENPNNSPNIVIEPFFEECLGSNSYDLHLAPVLKVYKHTIPQGMKPVIEYDTNKPLSEYSMRDWFETYLAYEDYTLRPHLYDQRNPKFLLDPAKKTEISEIKMPLSGVILNPLIGYLGSTVEYTKTYNLFPYIDGKSSTGRNFILNHHTAGRGDDGFVGHWTLEIHTLYPTVVYPGMRIGQIYYEEFEGARKPYHLNPASHYKNQKDATPAAPVPVDACIIQFLRKQRQL